MSRSIVPTAPEGTQGLVTISEAAAHYVRDSKAPATLRAYRSAWADFEYYCQSRDLASLPARIETLADYLAFLAEHGAKYSTITQRRAAIAYRHRAAGLADPATAEAVRAVLRGIARTMGTKPAKKAPLSLEDLRAVLDKLPIGLAGTRDRAVLLLGWAGAFRRSELVGLDVAHLRINTQELHVDLTKSKTDQEGRGLVKVIPRLDDPELCPVRALERWLDAGQIRSGSIFRPIDRWGHLRRGRLTAQSVARIVKAAAEAAGLQPRQLAGHSLRSGFITAAASAGAENRDIMAVTGHQSEIELRGYIQDAGLGAKRAIRAAFGE